MEEEKRRIKPVVVESGGEAIVSPDLPAEKNKEKEEEKPATTETESPAKEQPALESDVKVVEAPKVEAPEEKKSQSLTFILVTVLVALFVVLLSGGVYVYVTGTQSQTLGETPLPTSTPPVAQESPEASASPTAVPKADLAKYTVNILNGSGKIGEAGKVKTLIEKEGFKVGNTGNAASFDFEETVIQAKTDVPEAVVNQLTEAITGYVTSVGTALKESSTYDIVITVGSK